MFFVFVPALILEIFTTFFIIEAFSFNVTVESWVIIEFAIWNFLLVVPTFVAIYTGSSAVNQARKLNDVIGKLSSCCSDEATILKVLQHIKYVFTTSNFMIF